MNESRCVAPFYDSVFGSHKVAYFKGFCKTISPRSLRGAFFGRPIGSFALATQRTALAKAALSVVFAKKCTFCVL